jgi:cytochrome c
VERSVSRRLIPLVLLAAACGGERSGSHILASTGGDAVAGKAAIAKYGCGSCHVIPGVERARGLVGPPLTDFAWRAYIAGRLTNTAPNLETWIRLPDSVEPGTAMPTLGVSQQDARNIAAYLYLETGTRSLGPPRLLPATLLPKE